MALVKHWEKRQISACIALGTIGFPFPLNSKSLEFAELHFYANKEDLGLEKKKHLSYENTAKFENKVLRTQPTASGCIIASEKSNAD